MKSKDDHPRRSSWLYQENAGWFNILNYISINIINDVRGLKDKNP